MATITAQNIIDRVQIILQDDSAVRWTEPELLGWLNDAQREVVLLKPDSFTTSATFNLAAGTKQSLPALGITLVDITNNVTSAGVAVSDVVREVAREILDAQIPGWHSITKTIYAKFYTFDPRNPKQFFVYPPNTGAGYVDLVYASAPGALTANTETIKLDDIYANAIFDYILYRAYSKDAEYAANTQRAAASYQSFMQSLGLKEQAEMRAEPQSAMKPH
jgi:hypothetical protein